jgi:tRNA nucleotidyltransferase (CCA-adding enzyme)
MNTINLKNFVDLVTDCQRRDLTINSMAMGPEGIPIDPFGGMSDLKNKLLRHTSGAFAEDPLRVIRLARFYARYKPMGFRVANRTKILVGDMAEDGSLNEIPDERFWLELEKVFTEENPKFFFDLLWEIGALKNVSFFQRMLGKVTEKDLARIMNLATASMILDTPKQRLAAFTSLVNPLGTSAPTSDLAIYCRMGFCPEPEKVLDLFQKIRAFSEGPRAENLIDAVRVWEIANLMAAIPLSSKKLRQALEAARTVTAAPFVHLEGPEIGIQMSFARVEKIKSVL